jgi:hypothetical protein
MKDRSQWLKSTDLSPAQEFPDIEKPHRGFFKCREVVYTYSSEESYEKI